MIAFQNRQQKYRQQGQKQARGPAADLSAPQEDRGRAEAEILKVGAAVQLYMDALRKPRQELEAGVCSAGRRHPEPQERRKEGTLH